MNKESPGVKAVEQMLAGFQFVMANQEKQQGKNSDYYFWQGLHSYYSKIHQANLAGTPLAGTGMFIPTEILHAMEIPYLLEEYHGVLNCSANPHGMEQFFELAHGYGMGKEVCSPHRIAMGLALAHLAPSPTFILSTATTCDQTLKLYEVLSSYYKVPAFMVDSPFTTDERAIEYAKKEVRSLIKFVEEQSGKKMDYDKLKVVLQMSKQATEYWESICEMRKQVPTPISSRDAIKDFGMLLTVGGTPEGIDYFTARYAEVNARYERKEGSIPEERYRIAWLYVLPLFDLGIANWMEEEFGAAIVMDTFGYANPAIHLDPSDPIDFLAKKPLKWGFISLCYGALEDTDLDKKMAQQCIDYQADAAIALAHWSCKQYCGTLKCIKDQIGATSGIPFLILDGDICDPKVVSSAQMKVKIKELFAMLEAQRG